MTQSSYFLTNGSSLEDCHTNFFALADLCGIKWRQYSCDKNYNDLIDDPILNSYSKCLNADLLCVWRRVRVNNTQDQPNRGLQDSLYANYAKELWIFWYGDEPDFSDLLSNNLTEGEQGSWESGLSYECRTLLFKALHNLIERCLLSKGYARLGRWFFLVKDSDISDIIKEGTQVTFAFNFFLHGDSNVCANVDVRQHTAVRRISKEDVKAAQFNPSLIRVLLSPYGLQGYLTGHIFKDNDQSVQKFVSDWNKIFPLANVNSKSIKENGKLYIPSHFNHLNDDQSSNDDFTNKVVEVIIGDYKMKYPVSYIFITESDSKISKIRQQSDKSSGKNLSETLLSINKHADELLENIKLIMTPYYNKIPNNSFYLKNNWNRLTNFCDSTFSDNAELNKEESVNDFEHTQLSDLVLKKVCNCLKCQHVNKKRQSKTNLNSIGLSTQPNKSKERYLEKEKIKHMRNSTPFHHRSSLNISQDVGSWLLNFSSSSQSVTESSQLNSTASINTSINQSSSTPIIMSYKSPVSTSTSSILNTPGVESSPLSNFNLDAAEHVSPLPSKDENCSINTPNTILLNSSPKDKSNFDLLSPMIKSNDTNNPTNNNENSCQNNESNKNDTNPPCLNTTNENSNNERNGHLLKRSLLYRNIYDDNDHDLRAGLLYDFSAECDNWDIPVPKNRRIKKNSNLNGYDMDLNKNFSINKDPYEFSDFDDSEYNIGAKLQQEAIFESNSNVIENNNSETDINGTLDGHSKTIKPKIEGEVNCLKTISNSKFNRADDDYCDPDYFNSSGDESNDFQITKNINGNASVNDSESVLLSINNSNILGPAELSRMFPTPPSLEAMVASPCNTYIGSESKSEKIETTQESDKMDQIISTNSLDTDFKDWSFVYKPPIQSVFVTSTKYAPLENVEYKNNMPSNCYYKHNVKKPPVKSFNMASQATTVNLAQVTSNSVVNKSKSSYHHITPNKINPFPNSNIRNVRPTGQNMPMNQGYLNRMRPPLNMQQSMYGLPPDSFNGFRQNSPSLNIDNTSMSPMTNFISSPAPNFDNRKSPFPFPQQSLNSPSNPSVAMTNSPLNSFNMQQKISSPIMGPNMFNMNVSAENNSNWIASLCEANSLMLNLLLSDSMFNLFRDHNFESCCICVCNMNIKGNDVGIYLPDSSQQQPNYDYYQCTCGFSALTNRNLSQFSGLFYEDEVEITGIYYDPSEKKDLSELCENNNNVIDKELKKALCDVDENFINLVISQSTTIFPSSSTLSKIMYCDYNQSFKTFNLKENSMRLFERDPYKLVYKDYSDVTLMFLNVVRMEQSSATKSNMLMMSSQSYPSLSRPVLHDWPFRKSNFPVNNHEVILMLKTLQPLMQESVQRKGSLNEVTYNTVKGPLTWRQFHRLAGRGTEYQCEPQPIPSLLVGYDKDCIALSPFGLKFWEKLSLEPYAISRDVFYVVLTPDNDCILSSTRNFFKELTTTYETLRLGRHTPLNKLFRDGICPIGTNTVKKSEAFPLDNWFNSLGDSNLAAKIRLYAQACYNLLPTLSVYDPNLFESKVDTSNASYLNSVTSTLNGGNISNSYTSNSINTSFNSISQRPVNSFSHVNNSSENQIERLINEIDSHNSSHDNICQGGTSFQPFEDDDDPHKHPPIVIYIVEPFSSFGKEVSKLGCIGLLKSFSLMLKYIPNNLRNNVHLQLLSINSIMSNDKDIRSMSRQTQLKETSFSVYTQCRQQLFIQSNIKSLTGLGPAASFELFLKRKEPTYNITQLYTTPYILAPLKDKQTELGEMFGDRREKSQILFCCYCLTEDQKWLLASCTNDKGDILHTKVININVPNRTRRRNAVVRRFGLDKLMNFVQTVMSESVLPWRLVIGRLGRIGHGELKDWTFLLSKKSLLKYSRQLREMCDQCHILGPHDQPAIYSACLISLEADTALRVFPNYYTPDERFSSSCNTCSLSTPEDASCTHILVFPTSATTQSSHANFSLMDLGANLGDEFFDNLDESDIQVEDEIDLFENFWNDGLLGSPRRDGPQPDSPGNRQNFGASNSLKSSNILDVDQDEPAQLLQQPLALAFYVSTARTGPLPRWFWANSPHLENVCPVFLKSALLIHTPFVQQNTDDLLHSNNRDCHSLDSNLTTDVLRCALEGYNSLSWLVLNPATNDRLSCLPLHIQVLMQLYHSVQALI